MSCSTFSSSPPSPNPVPLPLHSSLSVACCPELDLSVTLSPVSKSDHTQQKPRPQKQSMQLEDCQQGRARNQRSTKVRFEELRTVTVTAEPHIVPRLQTARGPRKNTIHHHSNKRRNTVHNHAHRHSEAPPFALSNQHPGCLERAELNTTLALKADLQSLQEAEFNSQKALQETLQRSERTKSLINARATEVVNVSRSQLLFSSLVSVDVQKDQLINQVLQDQLLLAPPPPPRCNHAKTSEGPSLLFMTSDLIRHQPLTQNQESVYCKPSPAPRPAHSTFDLYSRQRLWEATP